MKLHLRPAAAIGPLPQVRGLFGMYCRLGARPPLIHTRLWITLWMYPSESVDNYVDNSVHDAVSARQRLSS